MVVNMYKLLTSLLCCFMIDNSYEDTSIFISRVWMFAGYMTFSYNKVSFFHQA